ncbi:MAG TPA: type II toxin-antitoxin system HicA family toxin [Parafilimonas sp.]|nr:type II toxin-antitoxin system HicA family toxin [Parafilimonas sp.]
MINFSSLLYENNKRKRICKTIRKKGVLNRINSSHHIYKHPLKTEIISLPIHKNNDLKLGLLKKLMSIAAISENEL